MNDLEILTQEDIAQALHRPTRWVRERLLKTNDIPSFMVGATYLVRREDFAEWIERLISGRESREQ